MNYDELYHYGVKGQKWGKRRYQYPDGSYKPGAEGRYYDPKLRRTTIKQPYKVNGGSSGDDDYAKKTGRKPSDPIPMSDLYWFLNDQSKKINEEQKKDEERERRRIESRAPWLPGSNLDPEPKLPKASSGGPYLPNAKPNYGGKNGYPTLPNVQSTTNPQYATNKSSLGTNKNSPGYLNQLNIKATTFVKSTQKDIEKNVQAGKQYLETVFRKASRAVDTAKNAASNAALEVNNRAYAFKEDVSDNARKAASTAKNAVNTAASAASSVADNARKAINDARSSATSYAQTAQNKVNEVASSAKTAVSNAASSAKTAASSIASAAKQTVKDFTEKASSWIDAGKKYVGDLLQRWKRG